MADTTIPERPETTTDITTKLEQLRASATQQYALKNYAAAAEFYSEAAELQDELHGEMSPENADLLYQYGRCLYHVAVSNSDVLGGKVASSEEPQRKKRKTGAKAGASKDAVGTVDVKEKSGEVLLSEGQPSAQTAAEELKEEAQKEDGPKPNANPFFQITGDENWTDSEDEDEEGDGEAEEEDDDFAIAYEILDVARVLLGRKLEAAQAAAGKATKESPESRHLKERLADTHDLQAEISLENERFHDAIADTKAALELKLQLLPQDHSHVAEAHYKLSLALEFASVTTNSAADGEEEAKKDDSQQVDESLRAEAASEMEKAIASCKARMDKETATLATLTGNEAKELQKSITNVKEIMAEMETRLVDLKNPAVSLSAGGQEGGEALEGVLGAMLGESKEARSRRVQEATEGANDLSGLVKHRKKKTEPTAPAAVEEGKGKRKAEAVEGTSESNVKKAKVEDA